LNEDVEKLLSRGRQLALLALNALPDHCARDMSELARRIGVDKVELINWGRADIRLARLLASKVAP
jgi:hypothetical protein